MICHILCFIVYVSKVGCEKKTKHYLWLIEKGIHRYTKFGILGIIYHLRPGNWWNSPHFFSSSVVWKDVSDFEHQPQWWMICDTNSRHRMGTCHLVTIDENANNWVRLTMIFFMYNICFFRFGLCICLTLSLSYLLVI